MDVVSLQLFVVIFSCLDGTTAVFTERPRNTVIQESLEVSLNCEVGPADHDIMWLVAPTPGGRYASIGLNGNVFAAFQGRYTLDYERSTPTSTSRSVLTITGVLPTDVGTFRCQDVPESDNVYSQLILLDGQPQVEANATMDDLVEGESFALSCHVGYTASISWRPTMTWREATDGYLPARDESTASEARYVYATETTRDHNGNLYQCSAEFRAIPEGDIPEGIRDQHDMAPPDYSFSSPLTDLTVNFPVENLVLENPKDIYSPGESLTFSAVARPGPSYYWQNLITNDTVSENILNVTPEMEGTQKWTYVAYNEIRGERFKIKRNHYFIVEIPVTTTDEGGPDPTEPSDAGKYIAGGVVAAIAVLVIGVGIGFALGFRRFRKTKQTETQNSQEECDDKYDYIIDDPKPVEPCDDRPEDAQYDYINDDTRPEACSPNCMNCEIMYPNKAYCSLNNQALPENPYIPLRK